MYKKQEIVEHLESIKRLETRIKYAKKKLFSRGKTLLEILSENLIDKGMEKDGLI